MWDSVLPHCLRQYLKRVLRCCLRLHFAFWGLLRSLRPLYTLSLQLTVLLFIFKPHVSDCYSDLRPTLLDHYFAFGPSFCLSVLQLYSGSRYHPDFCPTVCPSVLQLYSGFCPIVADHYPDFCPTVCSSVLQLFFSGFCITVPDRQFRLLSHCLSQCLTTLVRVLSYRLRHRPDFCPTKYSNNLDHYIMFVPLSRTIIQSFTPLC